MILSSYDSLMAMMILYVVYSAASCTVLSFCIFSRKVLKFPSLSFLLMIYGIALLVFLFENWKYHGWRCFASSDLQHVPPVVGLYKMRVYNRIDSIY